MPNRIIALDKIKSLVERFDEQKEFYKRAEYNETQTRRDFIDPFWKALGWDIDNENGYAESYREVIHEDRIKVKDKDGRERTKAPDYSFRLVGGKRLFFLEAKKPSVAIKDDINPAYQVRRYGWSAKMPISVITDFEELAIYDCTNKPKPTDKASNGRIKYLQYSDYLNEFDFIWDTFSKERVLKGSFDKYITSDKNKKGTTTVDNEFLHSLDKWRVELALNIALRNKNINEEELNFVVQHTIDRIIFLRIAEDRSIEQYGELQSVLAAKDFYKELCYLFHRADQKYNSGLFDFGKDKISDRIIIDNKVVKNIISELYYPICPYEFSVLSVEILGSAYEQFLGKQITLSHIGKAFIEEKPEVRKAGGVYYTPQYIVDYIVRNTIGHLLSPKGEKPVTPNDVAKLKIVDPACGSGSFLIGAYQYLLDWHKDYYNQLKNDTSTLLSTGNRKLKSKGRKDDVLTPTGELTTAEKKRILLNNIYGVDLDSNAVEVTKLSLLLKCMEGETKETIEAQTKLFHDRILPTLDNNIKSGNSLIDLDYYENEIDFGEERKVKPFSWQKAFPEVFTQGGFDCVIGNPPYVSIKELTKESALYYSQKYETGKGQSDLYSLFIERGISLLNSNGSIAYIVPDSLNDRSNFASSRKQLVEHTFLQQIITLNNVFSDANVGSTIFISGKAKNTTVKLIKTKNLTTFVSKEFNEKETTVEKIKDTENYNFLFVDEREMQILTKLFSYKSLSEFAFLGRGEELGKKSELIKSVASQNTLPFISGNDFGRYLVKNIVNYIDKNDVKKDISKLYGEKIIVRQVGKNITAAIDELKCVIPQSVYTVVPNDKLPIKYLLALFNSKLFDFIYQKKYRAKEIFPRILLENLKNLPMKIIDQNNKKEIQKQSEIIKYVEQLLQLNKDKQNITLPNQLEMIENRIEYTENKINELIYQLYELTEEEIKLIEKAEKNMHDTDLNKVVFHSKEDMAGGHYLQKGEHILRADTKANYTDINEVLELYNLKQYIDNDLYLKSWSQDDIANFKTKATEYGKVVGQFMATIDDNNVASLYGNTLRNYVHSFWELVNNQSVFKRISKTNFSNILTNEPHLIHEIITHKNLVDHYDNEIKNFLLTYSQSAEILLSIYEVQDDFLKSPKFIPKSLIMQDKENIISNYLDSNDANLNYVELIQNARNRDGFKVSDKTRLKAKRLLNSETEKILSQNSMEYGVLVSFPENATKLKDGFIDENLIAHYSYSLDFIKQYNDFYTLFRNFKMLFEYVDLQNRINLVSRKSQMGLFERIMGVHSQNEYRTGVSFSLTEMTSQGQIFSYSKVLNDLNISLESILNFVFTSAFQELYGFANNARFSIPSAINSYFEKVRLLAPEFESILKQFKLFVEDGNIDFELLQMSSTPTAIKDIPSLNKNKYIYFNEDDKEMLSCSNLFFSDQAHLTYVEPFKEKQYHTFFNLLANEQEVKFSNYEEFQKQKLQYLIDKGFISIDSNDNIKITNVERLWIFKDLHDNEFASFYRYPIELQVEVQKMTNENIVFFESSLFSKPEQSYFNYFLNKSEFTNGLDLRNSYLHGT